MQKVVRGMGPVLLLGFLGCDAGPTVYRAVPPGERDYPPTVEVREARLELGFAAGVLRKEVEVGAFRISRHPTTVGRFRACVEAGACSKPPDGECLVHGPSALERPNYGVADEDTPVTCVGFEQADAYCRWLGGELPSLETWALAARGRKVRRYAWGEAPGGCAEHPLADRNTASEALENSDGHRVRRCAEGDDEKLRVGHHPDGAAPYGAEDVLLTPGELVQGSPRSLYAACRSPGLGCVVTGGAPGAIDAVTPLARRGRKSESPRSKSHDGAGSVAQHASVAPYSFRCIWRES